MKDKHVGDQSLTASSLSIFVYLMEARRQWLVVVQNDSVSCCLLATLKKCMERYYKRSLCWKGSILEERPVFLSITHTPLPSSPL